MIFLFLLSSFSVVFIHVTSGFGQRSTAGKHHHFSTYDLCNKILSPFSMKGNGIRRQPCCLVVLFCVAYWHNNHMAVSCNVFLTGLLAPRKGI